MKTTIVRSITWSCSLAVIAFSLMGCKKQDSTSAPTTEDAQKTAAPVADTMKQTADSAKAAAETAVSDAATATADTTVTATGSKAQEWIDRAKSLVAESKYSEASSALQQLAALKLTDEQQKLVDTLKEQIQKALAAKATDEGASAVGNLLKK